MTRRAPAIALPALLISAVALAPFLHKPFTIDDPLFLLQAQHALNDPVHPSAFEMVWDDAFDAGIPRRAASISGPVMAWLLVPATLADGAEEVAHAITFAFLAIALLATGALARRFGASDPWAAGASVLVVTAPGVLGMAGTVMPDVPAMALGVIGLERLVAWKQERRRHQALLAAVSLGLAIVTRTHLALLIVIGALLLVGDFHRLSAWKDVRWRTWAPLAIAPLISLTIIVVTRDPHPDSGAVLGVPPQLRSPERIPYNCISFAAHWALSFPLVIPWLFVRLRSMVRRWWAFLVASSAASLALHAEGSARLPIALVAGISVAVFVDILADGWLRRDAVQLALGAWLLVPLAPIAYLHLPPKYLLAAAPAAALLAARVTARDGGCASRVALCLTAAIGLALGVAILRADSRFAEIGRKAADELIAPMAKAGHTVWFVGSWGFHWYAVRAGARPVTGSPPYPAAGDMVVISERSAPSHVALRVLARFPRATLVSRIEDAQPGGRVMSEESGAGFFSNRVGYLPWAWGHDLLDRFELWRLESPMTAAP